MKKSTYVYATIVAILISIFSIFIFFKCGPTVGYITTLFVLPISSISFLAGCKEGENTENKNDEER